MTLKPQPVTGPLLPMPAGPSARGGQTVAGLPYPSPQDSVCHTDQYIKDLAQAMDHRFANQALQMGLMTLVTNAAGDFLVTFPRMSVLNGLVIQPFIKGGGNGADVWTLLPFVVALGGNSAQVHVWYIPTNRSGYLPANFTNGGFDYAVFGWGVPV